MGEEKEKTTKGRDEWEMKAKEWLSNVPKNHELTSIEVNNWMTSNQSILPDDIKSLSQSDLLLRFKSILSSFHSLSPELKQGTRGENPKRFQRTDLWRPVYTWLESLDLDDVIKSEDISDWLAANPEIYNQLSLKHSRHHLMHYIKKCHIKMLKKKKGPLFKPNQAIPDLQITLPSKDSDLYQVKRQEALRKYDILVELEKQLCAIIPKPITAEKAP